MTGSTDSSDFPTTAGALHTSLSSPEGFVTKLSPSGSSLAYSTFLGGSGFNQPFAIAVDSTGAAYVTGRTGSADFPTTAGAFDTSYPGGQECAFISKLNAAGSALVYSTFLGGSSNTNDGSGIAIDSSGAAYVSGITASTNFPTTPGAFSTSYNGGLDDAFVTKLNPAGSSLVYSTYLGGSQEDDGNAIAIDSAGAAYVTGATGSANFPTTAGAFQTSLKGVTNGYVTKLNPSGSGLAYSTYLGGSVFEDLFGIAVDPSGAAFVTGTTHSTDYPTTPDAFQNSLTGGNPDVALTKLNAAGSGLIFSTYLGGSNPDEGSFLALDPIGSAYIVGATGSSDLPDHLRRVRHHLQRQRRRIRQQDQFRPRAAGQSGACAQDGDQRGGHATLRDGHRHGRSGQSDAEHRGALRGHWRGQHHRHTNDGCQRAGDVLLPGSRAARQRLDQGVRRHEHEHLTRPRRAIGHGKQGLDPSDVQLQGHRHRRRADHRRQRGSQRLQRQRSFRRCRQSEGPGGVPRPWPR